MRLRVARAQVQDLKLCTICHKLFLFKQTVTIACNLSAIQKFSWFSHKYFWKLSFCKQISTFTGGPLAKPAAQMLPSILKHTFGSREGSSANDIEVSNICLLLALKLVEAVESSCCLFCLFFFFLQKTNFKPPTFIASS